MMADYSRLTEALLASGEPQVTLSWQELDEIVCGLPASATKHHPQWWHGDRAQTRGRRNAGYELASVEVGRAVSFRRVADADPPVPQGGSAGGRPLTRTVDRRDLDVLAGIDPRSAMLVIGCSKAKEKGGRLAHTERLYVLLDELADRVGGPRCLRGCSGRDGWPSHGVYFFFEPGEERVNGNPRIVRVGTHGLRPGSRSTLWKRLRQHRGSRAGGGNHRGSIFRLHVGSALIAREHGQQGLLKSWVSIRRHAEWALEEAKIKRAVSEYIGDMPFLWLAAPTTDDGTSRRGYIERNCIAMLSCATGSVDLPSPDWLGHHAASAKVRASGLWNVNHVEETYDPEFLNVMAELVQGIQ